MYGIETIPEAIEDAKENAKLNNIENAEFFVGDVEKVLPDLIEKRNLKADVVFIDPPRKGCDKIALDTILKVEPKKVVYVSCNPATLARDLKILEEKYEIKEVTPVDMFPFTTHVECCSVLYLKN
jgi:23S rRNA (uracil1939-C5)-methyltransferase